MSLTDVRNLLSGGDYLKTKDVEAGPLTFGVVRVEEVEFKAKGDKQAEKKLVLVLAGDPPRKLSLNVTNLQVLVDAWGHDATAWVHRVFDAYLDKSVRDPSGKVTGGLRVRVRETGARTGAISAGANGADPAVPHEAPIPF